MQATATNTDLAVNYNNGEPSIDQSTPIDLKLGDTLTLQLSGFPSGASIDSIDFFGNMVVSGKDAKNLSDPKGS